VTDLSSGLRDSAEGSTSQRGLVMCAVKWVSESTECAFCPQSVTITLSAAQTLAQVVWMYFNKCRVCKASLNRPVNGIYWCRSWHLSLWFGYGMQKSVSDCANASCSQGPQDHTPACILPDS